MAFVDYLTVFYFTGVDNNLNPADFNLLCPNGSRKGDRIVYVNFNFFCRIFSNSSYTIS